MKNYKILLLLGLLFYTFTLSNNVLFAAKKKKNTKKKKFSVKNYVNKYKSIAISEMKRTGIPASITLAQGIVESSSGNSYLAQAAKNHFGIKCHRWKGRKVYAPDDIHRDCFRKYRSVRQSFIDHSNFLKYNNRYAFLFKKNRKNYRAWANGLKKAGYATNKNYAHDLIWIIEKFKLYKFDGGKRLWASKEESIDKESSSLAKAFSHKIEAALTADNIPTHQVFAINTLLLSQSLKGKNVLGQWQNWQYQHINKEHPQAKANYRLQKVKWQTLLNETDLLPMAANITTKSNSKTEKKAEKKARKKQKKEQRKRQRQAKKANKNKKKGLKKTQKQKTKNPQLKKVDMSNRVHVVKKGDTLYTLARRYKTSIKHIKSINRLADSAIKEDQKLVIR